MNSEPTGGGTMKTKDKLWDANAVMYGTLGVPSSMHVLQGDPSGQLKPPVDLVPPYYLGSRAVGGYSSGPPAARTPQT